MADLKKDNEKLSREVGAKDGLDDSDLSSVAGGDGVGAKIKGFFSDLSQGFKNFVHYQDEKFKGKSFFQAALEDAHDYVYGKDDDDD